MLKLKNLFENFELAREALKLYDHDERTLDRYFEHFRVSSNAIYPFRGADSVCFLRLSPAEEKPYNDVTSESEIISWLIGSGYPAMKPVPMKDGSFSRVLDSRFGTYNVSCFECVPGETLDDAEGTPEVIKGYGRTLGALHKLIRDYPNPQIRRDHNALMDEAYNRLTEYGAPDCVMREYGAVKRGLSLLPIDSSVYGIVHYDFEPDNVLYDAETGAFGVIDFDDSIRCWFALDAVRALDALDEVSVETAHAEAERLFLEGYRQESPFTDAQYDSLPLMRRLVALQQYAEIKYVLSEGVEDEPEWMTQIRGTLTSRLREIETGLT